jgi:hypothetical protein
LFVSLHHGGGDDDDDDVDCERGSLDSVCLFLRTMVVVMMMMMMMMLFFLADSRARWRFWRVWREVEVEEVGMTVNL